jgi:hypothetical protein
MMRRALDKRVLTRLMRGISCSGRAPDDAQHWAIGLAIAPIHAEVSALASQPFACWRVLWA